MHLIGPLIAGIRGAENGTAQLFVRGTSQRANYWLSFEADQLVSTGADLVLDANGGVEVYVGQLVDVVAKAANGTEVRRFVAGSEAPAVECITQSFTGTDYVTGQQGASKPTTLQAILDLWKTNAGAVDWKILVNGFAVTPQALAGALAGLVFNVKDPTYAAAGNGTADDTSAVQAAITACNAAGGGIVAFPPGTYRLTAALTLTTKVSLVGMGPSASIIKIDHASANTVTLGTATTGERSLISGLRFTAAQANSGKQIALTVNNASAYVVNCNFDPGGFACTGMSVSVAVSLTGVSLRMQASRFQVAPGSVAVDVLSGDFYALMCHSVWSTGAYALNAWRSTAGGIVAGCVFDPTAVTSGTFFSVNVIAIANTSSLAALVGNSFVAPTGGTHGIALARVWEFGNSRPSTVAFTYATSSLPTDTPVGSVGLTVERTLKRDTTAATVYTIPDDTGVLILQCTNAVAGVAFTTPTFNLTRRIRVYVWNDTAAARDFSFNTLGTGVSGTLPKAALFNVAGNSVSVFELEGAYVNGQSVWAVNTLMTSGAEP